RGLRHLWRHTLLLTSPPLNSCSVTHGHHNSDCSLSLDGIIGICVLSQASLLEKASGVAALCHKVDPSGPVTPGAGVNTPVF
ncbi:unnamed protein product, partial [Gulo gulo]